MLNVLIFILIVYMNLCSVFLLQSLPVYHYLYEQNVMLYYSDQNFDIVNCDSQNPHPPPLKNRIMVSHKISE